MTAKDTAAVLETQNLQHTLQSRHVQLIAIGGTISTGLSMDSGKTIVTAGPSILFVYIIIGAILFLFIHAIGGPLLSDSRYTTFADITRDLIGPWTGFVTGWTYWTRWIVTGVANVVAITDYIRFWWPTAPAWVPIVIMTALLFALNAMTVEAFDGTEFWFALVKIIAILVFVFVGVGMVLVDIIDKVGTATMASNLWLYGGFFPKGVMGFLGSFQVALFAFIGTELIGTTVAETTDPVKALPKAINSIPIRIVLFYIATLTAVMMVTPRDQVNPKRSPLVTMFSMTDLGATATIVNLVVLTSAASSANLGVYSTSRVLFGLVNQGDTPRVFSQLSKRHVSKNILFLSCVFLLGTVILVVSDDSISTAFTLVTSISATPFMGMWVVIVISYLIYPEKRPHLHEASTFKAPGDTASVWLALGLMAIMVVVLGPFSDTRTGLVPSLMWIGAVTVATLVHRHRMLKRAEMGQLEDFWGSLTADGSVWTSLACTVQFQALLMGRCPLILGHPSSGCL